MFSLLLNKIGSHQAKTRLLCKYACIAFFGFLAFQLYVILIDALITNLTTRLLLSALSLLTGCLTGSFIWRLFYPVECNICGWQGKKFLDANLDYGLIKENDICPSCESVSRHRFVFIYLQKLFPKNKNLKILHISPEISLQKFIQSHQKADYLSIDLNPEAAMQAENLENLSFPDKNFDLIICNHVLEHVTDDKRAIQEIFRVTKENGLAIISVPIDIHRQQTYENENIKSPEERIKHFWYQDHLRLYGLDFSQRLATTGFKVDTHFSLDEYKKRFIDRHGLGGKHVYLCYKK